MKKMVGCSGQSLTEFIIIIPFFFLIMSGVISIFHLQNRNIIDRESALSLGMSSAWFAADEKNAAQWEPVSDKVRDVKKEILDKAFNPSLAFQRATNKKDDIYLDKVRVSATKIQSCTNTPTFLLQESTSDKFILQTCSDKNGYDNRRASFSFQEDPQNQEQNPEKYTGSSLFSPHPELAWERRPSLPRHAAQLFRKSLNGIAFSKNISSLFPLSYVENFNKNCFMEPFSPHCPQHPYADKITRAAYDGANAQLLACYLEMASTCGAETQIMTPVCIAEGLVEINLSAQYGKAARHCPLLNQAVRALSVYATQKAVILPLKNAEKEAVTRN